MTCELIQGKKKHKKTHKKSEKNHTKLLFKKIRVRQNSERLVVEIFLRKKTSLYFFLRVFSAFWKNKNYDFRILMNK